MDAFDVAARGGLYLTLAATFGIPFFALYARDARDALSFPLLLVVSGVAGMFLSGFALLEMTASMAGVPVARVDAASLSMVLTATPMGKAWIVRVAALAVVVAAGLAGRARSVPALAAASVGGAVALVSLAWDGHGAMDEGAAGWLHLSADVAHLIAAGTWVGALACLLMLAARSSRHVDTAHLRTTHRALEGFSLIGTVVVAVIILTGCINTWMIVGPDNLSALPYSLYGRLLIAKVVLFLSMLCFAAVNRYRLTPALAAAIDAGAAGRAVRMLRISLALETMCAVVVLGLVACLGGLQPY